MYPSSGGIRDVDRDYPKPLGVWSSPYSLIDILFNNNPIYMHEA